VQATNGEVLAFVVVSKVAHSKIARSRLDEIQMELPRTTMVHGRGWKIRMATKEEKCSQNTKPENLSKQMNPINYCSSL
jgi:hypothetical protein